MPKAMLPEVMVPEAILEVMVPEAILEVMVPEAILEPMSECRVLLHLAT